MYLLPFTHRHKVIGFTTDGIQVRDNNLKWDKETRERILGNTKRENSGVRTIENEWEGNLR